MDDTTRTIVAYAVVLFGIPPLTAKILWAIPGSLVGALLQPLSEALRRFTDAVAEGFLSLMLSCLAFQFLDLPVVAAVPILLIVLHLLWNGVVHHCALKALPYGVGIALGFFLYPKVLTSLPLPMQTLA